MTTTPERVLTQDEQIDSLGRYSFGWADTDVAGAAPSAGCRRRSCATSRRRRASPSGCSSADSRRSKSSARSRCRTGVRICPASTSTTSSTSSARPRSRPRPGTTCPPTSRTPTTSSASRRRRSSAWCPASRRSTSPRWSTTRSARISRRRASSSWTPTPALQEHPELFEEYFGSVIPSGDNKFSALNTAVWSGGSFIYVPKGVHVEIPLQAYFRINTENMGQFERTLIIVDEGAYVHYVEGCTAPIYSSRLAALGRRRDHRQARAPGAATRRSRTGRTTSTTWSPSGPRPRPAPPWSGSTATSARRSR